MDGPILYNRGKNGTTSIITSTFTYMLTYRAWVGEPNTYRLPSHLPVELVFVFTTNVIVNKTNSVLQNTSTCIHIFRSIYIQNQYKQ